MNPKSPIGRGGFETRPNRKSSDWLVVVMPNHVHGIVVMVGFGIIVLVGGFETRPYGTGTRGFWHFGIGGYFGIVVFCRGGFQTRPHGRGHGDFVIVALVGILSLWSFVGAGFKPARTGNLSDENGKRSRQKNIFVADEKEAFEWTLSGGYCWAWASAVF